MFYHFLGIEKDWYQFRENRYKQFVTEWCEVEGITLFKIPGQAEGKRFYNYPYEAIEEALVNAVYHRLCVA